MNDFEEAPPPPFVPQIETSRLAIGSFLASVLCLPGISGVLGIVLGLFALRQINTTSSIQGANLAWVGILAGMMNFIGWGAAGLHVLEVRNTIDDSSRGFMAAWLKSEADGEAAAGPGLRTLMHSGEGETLRKALLERFGGFKDVGERSDFSYKYDLKGEHVHATYPLLFANGAPCSAEFEYAKQQGGLTVVGYSFTSPVLRDLVIQKHAELHGRATPDLRDYSEGGTDEGPSRIKSYKQ